METVQLLVVAAVLVGAGLLGMYVGSRKPDTRKQASDLWKSQLKTKPLKWHKDKD